MPESVSADLRAVARREEAPDPAPKQAPRLREVQKAAERPPYGAGYEMLSETIAKAQDIARQSALQLADARLHQATSLIGLQQTLLEMAHANMEASFAAAQKIVASPTLNEALAVHRSFAQGQVSALTSQASALRGLASKMTGDSTEPWADYWAKSFERIRKSFGA
jgi:Phasin protein